MVYRHLQLNNTLNFSLQDTNSLLCLIKNIDITAEPLHWDTSIQGTPSGDTSLGLEGVPLIEVPLCMYFINWIGEEIYYFVSDN